MKAEISLSRKLDPNFKFKINYGHFNVGVEPKKTLVADNSYAAMLIGMLSIIPSGSKLELPGFQY